MVTTCKCGKAKIISREKDIEYGQYHMTMECIHCNWYWEGYCGYL